MASVAVATGTTTDKVLAGMVTLVLTLVKSAVPAVPVVVVKVTVVGVALRPDRLTVKLTGLPSVALAAAIDTTGMLFASESYQSLPQYLRWHQSVRSRWQ